MTNRREPPTAFQGLLVLDFTEAIAGPFCTRLLGGFGANVLKVERPGVGDVARRHGPFPGDVPDPERSGLFLHLNGGKRSITLDLESASGRAIALDLARGADIVVEGFRPGTMERLGLGSNVLREAKPDVVLASVTNFGQTGPYRDFEGEDLIVQAIGGPGMDAHGMVGREPLKYGGNTGQYFAGLSAAIATAGAAIEAKDGGVGQHVDVAMAEALQASPESKSIDFLYTGQRLLRGGNANESRASYLLGAYPCADGYVGLQGTGRGETWWRRVYAMMDRPELSEDPRFSDAESRDANRDELDVMWYSWLADHTRDEVFAAAQRERFPLAPVYTPEDIVHDPHYQARGFFDLVDQPQAGPLVQPGRPVQMWGTPWVGGRPAPLLGQHNEQVYVGCLGFSYDDLRRLRAARTI